MSGLKNSDRRPAVRSDGDGTKKSTQQGAELAAPLADVIVLTKEDLERAADMFAPEEPERASVAAIEPLSDWDALELFAAEVPADELADPSHSAANLADRAIPDDLVADVPQFKARKLAAMVLVSALVVALAATGIAIVSRSPRSPSAERVASPPTPVQPLGQRAHPVTEGRLAQIIEPVPRRPALEQVPPEVGTSSAIERPAAVDPTNTDGAPRTPTARSSTPVANDLDPRSLALSPAIPARPLAAPGPLSPSLASTPTLRDLSPSRSAAAPELEASVPPVAPSAAVEPPAPAPGAPVTEVNEIQTVLSQYRTAFTQRDVGAASAVWPTVDQRALARAFDGLEEQSFEFDTCEITVQDVRAVAACDGTARYVRKVGNRNPRADRRLWRFSLRQVNQEWLIESVESR